MTKKSDSESIEKAKKEASKKKMAEEDHYEEEIDDPNQIQIPDQGAPSTKLATEKIKGNIAFKHSLYKLHLAPFLRNDSYKFLAPNISKVEHVHFFHSVNKRGKAMKYCAPVGGHFHEVKIMWDQPAVKATLKDEEGNPYEYEGPPFVCGPPLTYKNVRNRRTRAMIKRIAPVVFESESEKTGERNDIRDTHTHFIEYKHTEEIVPLRQAQRINAEKQKVQSIMDSQHLATQAASLSELTSGPLKDEMRKISQ